MGPPSRPAAGPSGVPSPLARRSEPGPGPVRSTDRAPFRQRPWTCRDRAHPQLLDHQPHRPRQVDAVGPHPRDHRCRRPPAHARAVPRLDGHRARAGHHHQGPERPGRLDGPHPPPDRHPRPRRLRLRGEPLPGRLRGGGPARSTPPRESRPRPWPTATRPSSTTSRSSPVLNKIDLPAADPERCAAEIEHVLGLPADGDPAHLGQDRRGGAARCSTPSSSGSRRPRAIPTPRCGRSSSTPPTTSTGAWSARSASWTGPCAPRRGCASCRPVPSTRSRRSACARPTPCPSSRARPRARSAT